jgi:hypothetical protein
MSITAILTSSHAHQLRLFELPTSTAMQMNAGKDLHKPTKTRSSMRAISVIDIGDSQWP